MPDFDLTNPVVLKYHEDSLRFWLERGLDGYRLDAVPHMVERDATHWNDQPESRVLTKHLQDLIKTYRHRYVVCEATAEPRVYAYPAVCGAAFAFGAEQHFIKAAQGDSVPVGHMVGYFAAPFLPKTMATFLSNHDIFAGRRLWDQLEGFSDRDARYKLAAAAYLLQPGTPFIYYGEEIGQAGVHGELDAVNGDWAIRSPRSWTGDERTAGFSSSTTPFRPLAPNRSTHNVAAQRKDPHSIRSFYKAMIGLRNAHPSISRGSYDKAFAIGLTAGWQRRLDADHTLVLLNHDTQAFDLAMPGLPPHARLQALWPRRAAPVRTGEDGFTRLLLPPLSVSVFRVRSPAP